MYSAMNSSSSKSVLPPSVPVFSAASDSALRDTVSLSQAWSNVAAPVAVVTLRDEEGAIHGTTITAFTSISFEPPILMISMAHTSSFLARLEKMPRFSLNVLTSGQQDIGAVCATKRVDKLAGVPLIDTECGPFIAGAAASFACHVQQQLTMGDHQLIFAEITHVTSGESQASLLYWQRQFGFSAGPLVSVS